MAFSRFPALKQMESPLRIGMPIRGRADTLENEKNTNCSIRTPGTSMHRPAHIILECIGPLPVLQRAEVCDGYDELGAQCLHTSSARDSERVLGSPLIAMNYCRNHARSVRCCVSTLHPKVVHDVPNCSVWTT